MHDLSDCSLLSRNVRLELNNFAWQIQRTRVNQRSATAADQ